MKKLFNIMFFSIIIVLSTIEAQVTQLSLGNNNFIFENNKWWIIDASSSKKYQVVLNSMTIKLADENSISELQNILVPADIKYSDPNILGFIDLTLPPNLTFQNVYQILSASGLFSIIEINSYGKDAGGCEPNDPYLANQYYLQQGSDWDIDAP